MRQIGAEAPFFLKGSKMNVSAIGSAPAVRTTAMAERLEGKGPDNDHDSDDGPAALAPGIGKSVYKSA